MRGSDLPDERLVRRASVAGALEAILSELARRCDCKELTAAGADRCGMKERDRANDGAFNVLLLLWKRQAEEAVDRAESMMTTTGETISTRCRRPKEIHTHLPLTYLDDPFIVFLALDM